MALELVYISLVVGATSVGLVFLGVKWLGCAPPQLWPGLSRTCETVGLALVLFVLNLSLGMVPILLARSLLGKFLSIYILSDTSLLILSLLQAMVFQGWWQCSRHGNASPSDSANVVRERV